MLQIKNYIFTRKIYIINKPSNLSCLDPSESELIPCSNLFFDTQVKKQSMLLIH